MPATETPLTLTLSPEDAELLRHVVQQYANALAALDEPKRGNSRLSPEGKANLATLRRLVDDLEESK